MSPRAAGQVDVVAERAAARDVRVGRPVLDGRDAVGRTRVRRVPGGGPLVDVAGHVEHSERTGTVGERPDGRRGAEPEVEQVRPPPHVLVSPGELAGVITARRPLPLVFGRQSHLFAELRADPGGEGGCFGPGDSDDRMLARAPVSSAYAAHCATVTGVRASRNAGTTIRVRGVSFSYQARGTPVSA